MGFSGDHSADFNFKPDNKLQICNKTLKSCCFKFSGALELLQSQIKFMAARLIGCSRISVFMGGGMRCCVKASGLAPEADLQELSLGLSVHLDKAFDKCNDQ